jgi:hypothetical protein
VASNISWRWIINVLLDICWVDYRRIYSFGNMVTKHMHQLIQVDRVYLSTKLAIKQHIYILWKNSIVQNLCSDLTLCKCCKYT